MCIRDSLRIVGAEGGGYGRGGPHLAVDPVLDVRDTRVAPCLLYTSDAADDLLCVDLGGRRSIKKKKTTTHE